MNSRKKVWLTGSVLAGAAALVAALTIPLVASAAKHPAAVVHCSIKSDQVVDISQFANDQLAVQAKGKTCSVSMTGSYKPGAIIAPVTVNTKMKLNPAGTTPGYTARVRNPIFAGAVSIALNNPKNTPPPALKIKITIGIDFKPPTVIIIIQF